MRHVDFPYSICGFGIARGDITPPVGIYHRLWGAAMHERATGVHRPLEAAAMIFRAADSSGAIEQEQALIAVDLCLLWAREMDNLLKTLCARTRLARAQIAVAC